jgi:hypothetical protein
LPLASTVGCISPCQSSKGSAVSLSTYGLGADDSRATHCDLVPLGPPATYRVCCFAVAPTPFFHKLALDASRARRPHIL